MGANTKSLKTTSEFLLSCIQFYLSHISIANMDLLSYRNAFKAKFENVYKLHELLDNINEENYQKLIDFIKEYKFHETKSSMSQFLRSINSFSLCRPKNINIYCQLLTDFIDPIQSFFKESEICSFFDHNRILLFFYDKKLISVQSIMTKAYYIHDTRYVYFNQELRKDEKLRYEKIYKDYENLDKYENDELFDKNRRVGFCNHDLCSAIREDDIELFQTILSNSDEDVVLRSKILASSMIYEKNNYLLSLDSMTFLNYAAYYGSLRIFKFLWAQSNVLKTVHDIEFAIAGGNTEIFHICEEYNNETEEINEINEEDDLEEKKRKSDLRKLYFKKILRASLFFHRNEIAEYIINNESQQIGFDIDLEIDLGLTNNDKEMYENQKNLLFCSFVNYHYALKNYNIRFLMDHIDDESIFDKYYLKYVNFEDKYHIELRKTASQIEEFDQLNTKKMSFDKNQTPLYHACYFGHPDVAELLLFNLKVNGNVSEVNEDFRSPFNISVRRQKNEIVNLLLRNEDPEFNMNPKDNDGLTPFLEACRSSNYDIFIELFNSSPKVDIFAISKSKSTPLHYAVFNETIEILDFLVSRHIYNIDAQDSDGWTPLMNGCDYDILQLVKILIEKGNANPNLVENSKSTAFMKYTSIDCIDCVKYLVDLPNIKESLNFQNDDGDTALHKVKNCPIGKDNQSILFLIQERHELFDLNIRNNKGILSLFLFYKTPLFIAVRHNLIKTVKALLMTKKVDANIKDNRGVFIHLFF